MLLWWIVLGILLLFGLNSILNSPKFEQLNFHYSDMVTVIKCEDIPEGISGFMKLNNKGFEFDSENFKTEIPIGDIISISSADSQQIINNSSFSIGKSLVGTAMFGVVGGVVGGYSGKGSASPKVVVVQYKNNTDDNNFLYFSQYTGTKNAANNIATYGRQLERLCTQMNERIKKINS